MKVLPALLLNVLVVGAGILLYDSLRNDPEQPGGEPLVGDAAAPPGARGLTGSADRRLAHSSEARIRGIEAAIGNLQAELERVRSGKGAGDSTADEPSGPVKIDAKTLHWMTAYRREILKREREAEQRLRMARQFERKGLELPEDTMEQVVRETLAFHERARALMRSPRENSAEGHLERKRAVRALRNEYESILNGLLPTAQVELILKTSMGKARDILPRADD